MSSGGLKLPAVGEPLLTLRSVSKAYGEVKAVAGVDMEIPRGSIYGFLGPNGAGKTTALRCIMNIILPDSGEVLLAGEPLGYFWFYHLVLAGTVRLAAIPLDLAPALLNLPEPAGPGA